VIVPASEADPQNELQFRLDRNGGNVVAGIMSAGGATASYPIQADVATKTLSFQGQTATDVAETWIAEKLLGLNPES